MYTYLQHLAVKQTGFLRTRAGLPRVCSSQCTVNRVIFSHRNLVDRTVVSELAAETKCRIIILE